MTVYLTPPPHFNPKMEVSACYVEYKDRILLLLRQDHKPQGNTWCLPGGKLDPGDTPLDAIIREMREETAIELERNNLAFFKSLYVKYPEMDFIYYLFHSRLRDKPEVKISLGEHKDHCWVTPLDSLKLTLIPKEDYCIKLFYKIE